MISYTIGCMMGRYSLDREGLVYAHAGNEGFKTLVEEGAYIVSQLMVMVFCR
jgi:type II restriction/modification system DNA methylase subunit YeeA